MVGYDLRFREELLRGEYRGAVVDIRNDYISYDASDNPLGFEFAVFRKSNGGYLVAYSTGAFHSTRGRTTGSESLTRSPSASPFRSAPPSYSA